MRVPIRKPGKYTHEKQDPHITEAKFAELTKELERLKASQPSASREVMRLAEMGDFSENAAYQMAKGRLRGINQKIIDIQNQLKRAVIIKATAVGVVQLGSFVTVEVAGQQKVYQLLGPAETNPLRGIISYQSPLGVALMGHAVGDMVPVRIGQGEVIYTILAIA